MSPSYPEDSIQYLCDPWWRTTDSKQFQRGRLLRTFVPHVDQHPHVLVAEGRAEPTRHDQADFRVEPLRVKSPPPGARLPVAALPHYPGEVSAVYRAKVRPVLVVSTGGPDLPKPVRRGAAKHQTNPTFLVAPYYGADRGGRTGGWNEALVTRIRRCEYPNYIWDSLPIGGRKESILRLDHLQPIGRHGESFELTRYRLSKDALEILDEWLSWLVKGTLSPDSGLASVRDEFLQTL